MGVHRIVPILSDALNKHKIEANDALTWLEVRNADAADHTVTILTQVPDIDGLDVPDRVVNVPSLDTVKIPLRPTSHNIRSGTDVGDVYIDPSVSTVLEFKAFRLPA